MNRIEFLARRAPDVIFYDWLSKDRFMVYLTPSSTVYLFKNRKLIDQYPVRPKDVLQLRQNRINKDIAKKKTKVWKDMLKKIPGFDKRYFKYYYLFKEFFIDKDSRNGYYLACHGSLNQKKNLLYFFLPNGKLKEVLYLKVPGNESAFCHFREKFGGKFIGIGKDKIFICKR